MVNEITGMVSDEGRNLSCVLATGSVVAGDFIAPFQTNTDDMFANADTRTFSTGSVAVIRVALDTDEGRCVGLALNDASSGDTVNVGTEGFYIGKSTAAVTAGYSVMLDNQGLADATTDGGGSSYNWKIGRAVTGASGASKYVLFKLAL